MIRYDVRRTGDKTDFKRLLQPHRDKAVISGLQGQWVPGSYLTGRKCCSMAGSLKGC